MGYLRTTHYSTTTKEVEPTEESLKELLSHEAEKTALELVQDIGNSFDSEVTYKTKNFCSSIGKNSVINLTEHEVVGLTGSCKLVDISQIPSSQAMADCNQNGRSASLVTNDDKPLTESVTAEEKPTARDVPSSKGVKRKSPASEGSASEPQAVRRSGRRGPRTCNT
ncbi:hypothetical protein VE00_10612 [Pseudogymnoascus sp. WSF 3629]|nr:hypothetical protein VE00_10612 [Pseudogymnoascus sp. WSF 3629]